jgi:acyl carrier protein
MNRKELIGFFSEFWGIEDSKIKDDLILNDENLHNHSSVRFYQFIAALESNFDVRIENINNVITFGDLSKNIISIKR